MRAGVIEGFDVLVVGGGTAGCVLAARLSENPDISVCLVEAGGEARDPEIADPGRWPFLGGRPFDWAYRTMRQKGTNERVHAWPRGKLLGGSSALNAMAHVRGHPDDFAAWAAGAGPRWSYAALLEAFKRSECFSGGASAVHGAGGPLPVLLPAEEVHPLVRDYIEAAVAIGAPRLSDHNAGPLVGVAPNQLTIRAGRRVTAADAYLTPARGRPNLSILADMAVQNLIIERGHVTGVRGTAGGAERTCAADVVVLAAGTVASPLLLMRSGVGHPETLRAAGVPCRVASPEVGRNLQDHLLAAGLVFSARRPVAPSRLQHSESLAYLDAADPARTDRAPDSVVACVLLPAVSERFVAPEPGTAFTLMFGFTHPESRGTIAISGPDLDDPPLIDPAYLQTGADRRAFRDSLRLARAVGHAAPLDPWRGEELFPGAAVRSEADIDAFLADAATTHHHPVGTCRMGFDPRSVVDGRLKVRGVDNLYVVDASVIPTILTGPINAAVTAIAEHWCACCAPGA